jgi:hypothetical protein
MGLHCNIPVYNIAGTALRAVAGNARQNVLNLSYYFLYKCIKHKLFQKVCKLWGHQFEDVFDSLSYIWVYINDWSFLVI